MFSLQLETMLSRVIFLLFIFTLIEITIQHDSADHFVSERDGPNGKVVHVQGVNLKGKFINIGGKQTGSEEQQFNKRKPHESFEEGSHGRVYHVQGVRLKGESINIGGKQTESSGQQSNKKNSQGSFVGAEEGSHGRVYHVHGVKLKGEFINIGGTQIFE